MIGRRPHRGITFGCDKPRALSMRVKARWYGVDSAKAAAAAMIRQAFPVIAYTGSNGGGKTACAVYDMLPTLAGKRWECRNIGHSHAHAPGCTFRPDVLSGCICDLADPLRSVLRWGDDPEANDEVVGLLSAWDGPIPGAVEGDRLAWSTTALLDGNAAKPVLHPRYRPLRSLRDLVRCEHGDVLLDEVQGVADARDHQSMPVGFRKMVYELRRRDVVCRWTAVDYSAADARMRQITQLAVQARGFFPAVSVGGRWQPRQMLRWSAYDASDFDHFTVGSRKEITPLAVQWVWRPGHLFERSYDTLAPVLSLTMASESGQCMNCGGSKSRDKCGCPTDETLVPTGVVVETNARGTRVRRPAALVVAATEERPQRSEDAPQVPGQRARGRSVAAGR